MKVKKFFLTSFVLTLLSLGLTSCDFLMQTASITFYNNCTSNGYTTIVSNLKLYDKKGHLIQNYSGTLETGESYPFDSVDLYKDYYFTFDMETKNGNIHYVTDYFYLPDDYVYDLYEHRYDLY